MTIKLKPQVEKLEKIRKSIILPAMLLGTIVTAGIMFSLKFLFKDQIPVDIEGVITFNMPPSWLGIIAVIYLAVGIGFTVFLNNHLKNRHHKLLQEFLEISEDKIYLNRHDGQEHFKISDALNYENVLDGDHKSVIGFAINFKDGQKIELIHYDKKELEENLKKMNIIKKQ